MLSLGRLAKRTSIVSRTTRFALIESMALPEPYEESFEVVFSRLLDLAPLDIDVIDRDFLLIAELFQIEPEGFDVLCQLLGGLFEGHEDARLVVVLRAVDEELHGKERLAGARASGDKRGPAFRQTAARDLVKPLDAGQRLLKNALMFSFLKALHLSPSPRAFGRGLVSYF